MCVISLQFVLKKKQKRFPLPLLITDINKNSNVYIFDWLYSKNVKLLLKIVVMFSLFIGRHVYSCIINVGCGYYEWVFGWGIFC